MKLLANFHAFSQQSGSKFVIEVMFIFWHTAMISQSNDIDNVYYFDIQRQFLFQMTYRDIFAIGWHTKTCSLSEDKDNVVFFFTADVFFRYCKINVILTYRDDISEDIDNIFFYRCFFRCCKILMCYLWCDFCYPLYVWASHIVYYLKSWKLKQIELQIL